MSRSVSDLPKIDTRTSTEFDKRSIRTKSIEMFNREAMLARTASVAFSICDTLEFIATPASEPATATARGTIATHTPDTLMYPVTHQQSDKLTAAPDVDVSAGQVSHKADPVAALYVPATQGTHVLPAGPVYPASQMQFVRNPLPVAAREFAGHKLQFGLPSGDHCPAGQDTHVSLPIAP